MMVALHAVDARTREALRAIAEPAGGYAGWKLLYDEALDGFALFPEALADPGRAYPSAGRRGGGPGVGSRRRRAAVRPGEVRREALRRRRGEGRVRRRRAPPAAGADGPGFRPRPDERARRGASSGSAASTTAIGPGGRTLPEQRARIRTTSRTSRGFLTLADGWRDRPSGRGRTLAGGARGSRFPADEAELSRAPRRRGREARTSPDELLEQLLRRDVAGAPRGSVPAAKQFIVVSSLVEGEARPRRPRHDPPPLPRASSGSTRSYAPLEDLPLDDPAIVRKYLFTLDRLDTQRDRPRRRAPRRPVPGVRRAPLGALPERVASRRDGPGALPRAPRRPPLRDAEGRGSAAGFADFDRWLQPGAPRGAPRGGGAVPREDAHGGARRDPEDEGPQPARTADGLVAAALAGWRPPADVRLEGRLATVYDPTADGAAPPARLRRDPGARAARDPRGGGCAAREGPPAPHAQGTPTGIRTALVALLEGLAGDASRTGTRTRGSARPRAGPARVLESSRPPPPDDVLAVAGGGARAPRRPAGRADARGPGGPRLFVERPRSGRPRLHRRPLREAALASRGRDGRGRRSIPLRDGPHRDAGGRGAPPSGRVLLRASRTPLGLLHAEGLVYDARSFIANDEQIRAGLVAPVAHVTPARLDDDALRFVALACRASEQLRGGARQAFRTPTGSTPGARSPGTSSRRRAGTGWSAGRPGTSATHLTPSDLFRIGRRLALRADAAMPRVPAAARGARGVGPARLPLRRGRSVRAGRRARVRGPSHWAGRSRLADVDLPSYERLSEYRLPQLFADRLYDLKIAARGPSSRRGTRPRSSRSSSSPPSTGSSGGRGWPSPSTGVPLADDGRGPRDGGPRRGARARRSRPAGSRGGGGRGRGEDGSVRGRGGRRRPSRASPGRAAPGRGRVPRSGSSPRDRTTSWSATRRSRSVRPASSRATSSSLASTAAPPGDLAAEPWTFVWNAGERAEAAQPRRPSSVATAARRPSPA